MELTQELVKKKVELLEQQKAKAVRLNELLDGESRTPGVVFVRFSR